MSANKLLIMRKQVYGLMQSVNLINILSLIATNYTEFILCAGFKHITVFHLDKCRNKTHPSLRHFLVYFKIIEGMTVVNIWNDMDPIYLGIIKSEHFSFIRVYIPCNQWLIKVDTGNICDTCVTLVITLLDKGWLFYIYSNHIPTKYKKATPVDL